METLQRDHWSARKSLLVLFGDWGIATAAFVLAYSMHHYNGDSIIPGLVSVAAIAISAVSFVGAPIVVVRRSGQSRWLFAFFVSGVLIGGFLLGRFEYHHVRSAHALAKIQKAFGAAEQVTKTIPPPQLSDLPPYQANPQACRPPEPRRFPRTCTRLTGLRQVLLEWISRSLECFLMNRCRESTCESERLLFATHQIWFKPMHLVC